MKDLNIKEIANILIFPVLLVLMVGFTKWPYFLFLENKRLLLLVFLFTFLLLLNQLFKSSRVLVLLLVGFILLSAIQVKTTKINKVYSFTPYESDLQIQRMNYYQPKLARLGYILEHKKQVQYIYILEKNFFDVFGVGNLFPEQFTYLGLPFFLIGIFYFVVSGKKVSKLLLFLSIAVLTVFGVNGIFGPILLYPFILFFIMLGVLRLFKLTNLYENK